MSIYIDNQRLLTESDKQPQWNLLKGTQDFSGEWAFLDKSADKFGDFTVANYFNRAWNGVGQYYKATVGTYTFSFWARSMNSAFPVFIFLKPSNDVEATPSGAIVTAATVTETIGDVANINEDWKKIVVTSTVSKAGALRPRVEVNNNNQKVQVARFKLEHGSIATPWMPAIADLMLKNQNGG